MRYLYARRRILSTQTILHEKSMPDPRDRGGRRGANGGMKFVAGGTPITA